MKNAPELDKKLVLASAEYLAPKYKDDAKFWGKQEKIVWGRYQDWLFKNDLIKKKIDVSKAYTNEFLEK